MSIALLIRQMVDAGAPPEAIAIAVEAIEALEAADEERRAAKREVNRERQRRHRLSHVTERDNGVTVTRDPPTPDKERSPTPPKEINPTLFCASEDKSSSALVDGAVDATPTSKKIERTESDEKLLDEVTDVWNAWAVSHRCPQVKFLTKTRAQHCRQRLKDVANGDEPIVAFRKVLSKCETSFFIRGSPRSRLKFDQIMREGFLSQMLEGAFEYQGTNQWRR